MNAHLDLKRHPSANGCTLGELSLNGKFFCYTLEHPVRPAGQQVAGHTAVAAGHYPIALTMSPRLRILTPRLGGAVAGLGYLLHVGNTVADSQGCILVGFAKLPSNIKIYQSQEAFQALMHQLLDATTIDLTIH
ncbi:MAG: DUF5675 family protein [Janthinobacterium lividum]